MPEPRGKANNVMTRSASSGLANTGRIGGPPSLDMTGNRDSFAPPPPRLFSEVGYLVADRNVFSGPTRSPCGLAPSTHTSNSDDTGTAQQPIDA